MAPVFIFIFLLLFFSILNFYFILLYDTVLVLQFLVLCLDLILGFVISGLHWWLGGKESACQCRRRRFELCVLFPGEGNNNPLQYSCLGNPTDREA